MSDEPRPDQPDTSGWVSPGRQVPAPPPPPLTGRPAAPQPAQAYPPQPPQAYPPQPYYGPGWHAPLAVPPAPAPVGSMPARRPRGRAEIVLRVIAALATVTLLVGAAIGGRYWLDTRPLGTVTHAMTVHAGRVTTGHCIQTLPQDGTVASVRLVPCDQPHAAEVVGSLDLPGTSWPGSAQVADQLVAWCEMDATQQGLGLLPVVWGPSARGWAQGDRSGLCLAWSPTGTMTGSFVAGDTVTVG